MKSWKPFWLNVFRLVSFNMRVESSFYCLVHCPAVLYWPCFLFSSSSQTDAKGRVNSLTTVLGQEVDRFNSLLKVIKVR